MNYRISRALLVGALAALPLLAAAQTTDTAQHLIDDGNALRAAGRFAEALPKYQAALQLEPASNLARYKLALTYFSLGRHDDAIRESKALLAAPDGPTAGVYIIYGNALDGQKKPKEAVDVYQQGLRRFPDDGMLHFNLGVTQYGQQRVQEAIGSLQRAAQLNPDHASSHLYLALLTAESGNRIPSILELGRFLVLEPQGPRAAAYLPQLDRLLQSGVKQTGEKDVTVKISSLTLDAAGKPEGDDNFGASDMMLSLMSALDYDAKNKGKTPSARMAEKLNDLISSLGEQGSHKGFAWSYYVPYYLEMKRKNFVPAFTYVVRASRTDQPDVQQWLDAHPAEVAAFREWSKNYEWK